MADVRKVAPPVLAEESPGQGFQHLFTNLLPAPDSNVVIIAAAARGVDANEGGRRLFYGQTQYRVFAEGGSAVDEGAPHYEVWVHVTGLSAAEARLCSIANVIPSPPGRNELIALWPDKKGTTVKEVRESSLRFDWSSDGRHMQVLRGVSLQPGLYTGGYAPIRKATVGTWEAGQPRCLKTGQNFATMAVYRVWGSRTTDAQAKALLKEPVVGYR